MHTTMNSLNVNFHNWYIRVRDNSTQEIYTFLISAPNERIARLFLNSSNVISEIKDYTITEFRRINEVGVLLVSKTWHNLCMVVY